MNYPKSENKAGKLNGKIAVVTGGTTGIGLAAAQLFVKEGAYVFIMGRRQKELDEAVNAIGSNVAGVQGDVANLADLDRLYEAVSQRGRIDVLFANAGVAEFSSLEKITEAHFDKLFDINVRGTRGRIKDWTDQLVYVVYQCDDQWDRFEEYTAAATDPEDLDFL